MKNPAFAIKTFSSDWLTPISAFEALRAKALLESAYTKAGSGRYSLLVLSEAFVLLQNHGDYFCKKNGVLEKLDSLENKNFLDYLEYFYHKAPKIPLEILEDFPLPLGGVGYLGYEFFSSVENVGFQKDSLVEVPECAFLFGRDFLIFDRLYDEAHLVSINYENENYHLEARIEDIMQKLANIQEKRSDNLPKEQLEKAELLYYEDFETFREKLEYIHKEIYKGNLMQCVLSRKIALKTPLAPWQAYRNLRQKNPSTYMFYLCFEDFIILGSSPEVMVKLEWSEGKYQVVLRPIAGTRARGRDKEQDSYLTKELLDNPKENAEHLMLVDLGRNDVGKVCKAGSVRVGQYRDIEKYSRVIHMVSSVCGELCADKDVKDVIYATFPAGTVSGAAKIQAIKTLAHLEPYKRGVYAGMIGYFYPTQGGKMGVNSCIAIRTAVFKEGVYYLQAGAGIVYDSEAQAEFLETNNKLQSLVDSILGYGSRLEDLIKH